ncbi:hypothetical protein LIT25_16400 [Bacillus sp. F19]|nr:hypothetical protein LIT25_16400 [Bacillus sp. F19]
MKETNKDFTCKIPAERNGDCKIRKLQNAQIKPGARWKFNIRKVIREG